jgi:hypothetical protein
MIGPVLRQRAGVGDDPSPMVTFEPAAPRAAGAVDSR